MEKASLNSVKFMTQSQYASESKTNDNLYMVEFQPDLNMFPDYSTSTWINANTTYTVGSGVLADYKEGWFRIGFTSSSWHGQDPQLVIWINGQVFYISYFCAFTMVYLSEGNTFSCNSTYRCDSRFFPIKAL
jgi:hypothetical protein